MRYLHQDLGTCLVFPATLKSKIYMSEKNNATFIPENPEKHGGGRLHIETSSRVCFPVHDFLFSGFNGFEVVAST